MYVSYILFYLVGSPPGVLVVPLFSAPLGQIQVLVGNSFEFSYLIALVNSSLNVTTSVSITYRNRFNSRITLENLKLIDRGGDIYTFSIPPANLSMDQTMFALQFAGRNIVVSQVILRVTGM